MLEKSIFYSSFQAENDQMPTNQDWAIIFQTPLPSNAKVLSKCKDRVQISPAAFAPYVGSMLYLYLYVVFVFFSTWVKTLKAVIENETKDLWWCS